jgi:hypothetical protein
VALRDLGVNWFAICGIATEIGIEPTVHHSADLGYIPVVVEDACGAGDEGAGKRSLESLRFAGDAMFTDTATIGSLFRKPVASAWETAGLAPGGAGWGGSRRNQAVCGPSLPTCVRR